MDLAWQVVSFLGMAALLVAYLANRRGTWAQDAPKYLWCNALGALVLAAYSVRIEQWVFVILEGWWSIEGFRGLFATRSSRGA